jgi:prolyl-tRNA editing enzyme YbaK/EbsC (Cys-tRNA(Pro) deacylase)
VAVVEEQLGTKVADELERLGVNYRIFPCEPDYADTEALISKYGFARDQIVNTIIVAGKGERFVACVVLATSKVDVNRKVCQLLGVKRATFAASEQTARLTGMMIGGVTVFGLPDGLPIYVDQRVMEPDEILLGSGTRSSKILLHPEELRKIPNIRVVPQLGILRT